MKILFFISKLYGGGAERVASILLNHFCEKHDTYVALTDFNAPFYHIDNRIHIIDNRIKSKIKGATRIPPFIKMAQTIKNTKPDIIISFITRTNNNSLIANLLYQKKIIVSERNTLNYETTKTQKILRKILYPTADKIVVVTSEDCNQMPKKSLLIYNPTMFKPFASYNNRQKTIVTIAPVKRWYPKGIDLLIKAWAKIATTYPDWNLEIYGRINDGIRHNELCPTYERANWMGWCDNIDEIFRTRSIFAITSRSEACPNSLLEAMSQGCACIGTDCEGGIKEIITDGVDGLLAKSENIDDIAAKLQILIDDEHLRRELSAGAIEKAKQFDKNVFFAKWDKLIEEVVEK
ncbi:MAG: glycosyltransferase [Salinivirgaceae bacterium]|nr:glycosyltransferase [Salinivirgaceae bacterium]